MVKVYQFKGGYDRNFCYLVVNESKEALLIDPFVDSAIDEKIKQENLQLKYILNTHSHFDHTEGNSHYQAFGAKIVITADKLAFGETEITFIPTPGHTSDSRCILIETKLFTGDTLFVGKVGGTSGREDAKQEWDSLQRLMQLPDSTIIYPGHDYGIASTSTISNEKSTNPFLAKDFDYFLWLKENWQQYKEEHRIK